MGQRGPAPLPKSVLEARGSWRAKVAGDAPPANIGRPRCPAWLDRYAKAAWKQLIPMLEANRTLYVTDAHALAVLCQTWSRWRTAEEFIIGHGTVYPVKDHKGHTKELRRYPQVAIAQESARTLNRLLAEFGLTPSARSRITSGAVPDQSPDANDSDTSRFFSSAGRKGQASVAG